MSCFYGRLLTIWKKHEIASKRYHLVSVSMSTSLSCPLFPQLLKTLPTQTGTVRSVWSRRKGEKFLKKSKTAIGHQTCLRLLSLSQWEEVQCAPKECDQLRERGSGTRKRRRTLAEQVGGAQYDPGPASDCVYVLEWERKRERKREVVDKNSEQSEADDYTACEKERHEVHLTELLSVCFRWFSWWWCCCCCRCWWYHCWCCCFVLGAFLHCAFFFLFALFLSLSPADCPFICIACRNECPSAIN